MTKIDLSLSVKVLVPLWKRKPKPLMDITTGVRVKNATAKPTIALFVDIQCKTTFFYPSTLLPHTKKASTTKLNFWMSPND